MPCSPNSKIGNRSLNSTFRDPIEKVLDIYTRKKLVQPVGVKGCNMSTILFQMVYKIVKYVGCFDLAFDVQSYPLS